MQANTFSKLASLVLGILLLLATACATKRETGAAVGAGGGAVVGGLVGGRTGAVVGALVGGAVGYGVGYQMDREDQRRFEQALERNREVQWRNTQTGHTYEVEPTRTVIREGRECREFRMTGDVDGRPDEVYGTACRASDGSWQMIGG